MDNSGTKKEWVGRTYQGVDGYTPIAAYLGNEGWCVGLELRPGTQHSALETHYFLERVLPRVRELVVVTQSVLSRSDSGFDSARLLFQQDDEKRSWASEGRTFEYLVKWNPRQQDLAAWVARAEAANALQETRPGKRVALLDLTVERAWKKERRNFRLIVRVTERTIDRHGQHLLVPEVQSRRLVDQPARSPAAGDRPLRQTRHARAIPLGDQNRSRSGAPALRQIRLQ